MVETQKLAAHLDSTSNPHYVTKEQVELGAVENKPMDDIPKAGSTNYITSNAVALVKSDLSSAIEIHKNDNTNPHQVTAAQLGLGLVVNATMDEKPSNTDHYVKSSGVKAAIDEVQENVSKHISIAVSGTNPHHTTK
jgi:hypothetical protein